MDDRTMLELAAKSAGIEGVYIERDFGITGIVASALGASDCPWNPLENDGDALRLVVTIGFSDEEGVSIFLADKEDPTVVVRKGGKAGAMELAGSDPLAATRRAITRAAAEIQLAKESGK